MPRFPRESAPIALLPSEYYQRPVAAEAVQYIGRLVNELVIEKGLPLTAEMMLTDHSELNVFVSPEQAEISVGSAFAPDFADEDEVIKVTTYNELGKQLVNEHSNHPPGRIESEIKLTKLDGTSELRSLMSVLDTGELVVRGSCYVKWSAKRPSVLVGEFADRWGLESAWRAYLDFKKPGRIGEFDMSATDIIARKVQHQLEKLRELPD